MNRRREPERNAPDTWVIRQLFGEGVAPVGVQVNSLVTAGAEPVIVDPSDVRWIFASHDDAGALAVAPLARPSQVTPTATASPRSEPRSSPTPTDRRGAATRFTYARVCRRSPGRGRHVPTSAAAA